MQQHLFKLFGLAFGLCLAGSLMFTSGSASAAYNGGHLIDDVVFTDSGAMSKGAIRSFLNNKDSGLKDLKFKLDCYGSDSKEHDWYTSIGAPCGSNILAADIIYYASRVYGMNPRVALATLQKEQSLITTKNPTQSQLDWAMGYGCPTSSGCQNGDFAQGFSRQLDHGMWVLRYHFERARKNNTWWDNRTNWTCGSEKNFYKPNLYPKQNVKFYDQDDVHYRTHFIASASTSSLYCYTPHAYNNPDGLFGLPKYGTKGRYYTGSYNFVSSFESWFGSTLGEKNAVYRLYKKDVNNHLFTTSRNERDKAITEHGFKYEGVAFKVCATGSGTDIYRMYSQKTGRHFFTTSKNEYDKAARTTSFKKEGVAFKACGTKKVHRLYSAKENKHHYTTSEGERDNLVKKTSFVYEGVAFRVN